MKNIKQRQIAEEMAIMYSTILFTSAKRNTLPQWQRTRSGCVFLMKLPQVHEGETGTTKRWWYSDEGCVGAVGSESGRRFWGRKIYGFLPAHFVFNGRHSYYRCRAHIPLSVFTSRLLHPVRFDENSVSSTLASSSTHTHTIVLTRTVHILYWHL